MTTTATTAKTKTAASTKLRPILLACLVLVQSLASIRALSSPPAAAAGFATVDLVSTGPSQSAVLDGGEWSSVRSFLRKEGRLPKSALRTGRGCMTIATGRTGEGLRVVGMQESSSSSSGGRRRIFEESVAAIPTGVDDADAISTYIAALSTVHCALPKTRSIGGSSDDAMINNGRAVVLGSNSLACFAAEGLASFGLDVFLVSTGNPKVKKTARAGSLRILKPAVGDDEVGFSSYIGEFDSLVDTIGNELKTNFLSYDDDDDDDVLDAPYGFSTLGLLKSRHNCQRYVSTETECQKIVAKEGIFGGPGKADGYAAAAGAAGSFSDDDGCCGRIPPPKDIGDSVASLLDSGVVFASSERRRLLSSKSDSVRGWTLGDFWEKARWPRDASGSSDVRFGLPAISFEEEEEAEQQQQAELSSSFELLVAEKRRREVGDGTSEEDEGEEAPQPTQTNPYVLNINGVSGMTAAIGDAKKDCVLFLSARFCQTCKRIDPKYTRMARIEKDNNDSPVLFAKAEMGSSWGKKLGKHLDVDAVPSFVLFRKGERFGPAISVSDLPSDKIDKALDLLESGGNWDPAIAAE